MGLFCRKRKKVGEILIEKGLATKEDIEEALRIQKEIWESRQIQKNIGAILHERGIIELEDIEEAMKEQEGGEGFILKGLIYSIFHAK